MVDSGDGWWLMATPGCMEVEGRVVKWMIFGGLVANYKTGDERNLVMRGKKGGRRWPNVRGRMVW